jgi:hypothetical protein
MKAMRLFLFSNQALSPQMENKMWDKHRNLNFLKTVCLFIIYLLSIGNSKAQNKPERDIQLSAGVSHLRILEQKLSPMVYTGPGFTGNAAWNKRSTKAVQQAKYSFQYALTQNGISSAFTGTGMEYQAQQLQYTWLKSFYSEKTDAPTFSIGPQLSVTQIYRRHTGMYNNAAVQELRGGLDLHLQWYYPFRAGNRNWSMKTEAEIPVFGMHTRPAWGSWRPNGIELFETPKNIDYLRAAKIATLNRYLRIFLNWELNYALKNGNRLGGGMYQVYTRTSDTLGPAFLHAEYGFYLCSQFAF